MGGGGEREKGRKEEPEREKDESSVERVVICTRASTPPSGRMLTKDNNQSFYLSIPIHHPTHPFVFFPWALTEIKAGMRNTEAAYNGA